MRPLYIFRCVRISNEPQNAWNRRHIPGDVRQLDFHSPASAYAGLHAKLLKTWNHRTESLENLHMSNTYGCKELYSSMNEQSFNFEFSTKLDQRINHYYPEHFCSTWLLARGNACLFVVPQYSVISFLITVFIIIIILVTLVGIKPAAEVKFHQ